MKRLVALWCVALALAVAVWSSFSASTLCFAQAGFEDGRVMLQGFYWESYRHGDPKWPDEYGDKRWYVIVKENAAWIREARFDLFWLPPPSYAGSRSAGYNPKEYFKLENDTGFRTKEDGQPEKHHESDSFANNSEVEQAYAYILTHPGIPCVFWKHYFE